MLKSDMDVENEWIILGIGIKNIILYLIFIYKFLNFTPLHAYLDPPHIKFSENFPQPPLTI